MKILQLYDSLNIPYLTEGNKHCAPGWINTHCPFCTGSQNYHLGYNIQKSYYNCYRCGHHNIIKTLSKFSGLSYPQIKELIRQFGGKPKIQSSNISRTPRAKGFQYPSGIDVLQ